MALAIPSIPGELQEPVSALTRAAVMYRGVLFKLAVEHREIVDDMLAFEPELNLADAAIKAWRAKLGHDLDEDDEPEDV